MTVEQGAYNWEAIDNPFGNPDGDNQEDDSKLKQGPVVKRAEDKNFKKRLFAFEELIEIAQ